MKKCLSNADDNKNNRIKNSGQQKFSQNHNLSIRASYSKINLPEAKIYSSRTSGRVLRYSLDLRHICTLWVIPCHPCHGLGFSEFRHFWQQYRHRSKLRCAKNWQSSLAFLRVTGRVRGSQYKSTIKHYLWCSALFFALFFFGEGGGGGGLHHITYLVQPRVLSCQTLACFQQVAISGAPGAYPGDDPCCVTDPASPGPPSCAGQYQQSLLPWWQPTSLRSGLAACRHLSSSPVGENKSKKFSNPFTWNHNTP